MDVTDMISDINAGVPVSRRSLAEHIDSGDLTYRTRSGHTCEMTRDEIDILCGVCADHKRTALKLPILVMTDTSSEQGAWKVEGRTETAVVSKLLSKQPLRDDRLIFYHPHLRELQRILPNAAAVVFVP
ncbi:MAG: DUF61 family protein [Methanomassiliicoccaceae archaeon]|nr:DUF61 family protein [Methanomassiliicoccaceae archaeon]